VNASEDLKVLARQRVILEVLTGRLTVTQAAQELGVSRKTFYEWQHRALAGMRAALRDRPGGRPPVPVDPQQEQLQAQVTQLSRERAILEGRLRIQEAIREALTELPEAKKRCERMIAVVDQVKRTWPVSYPAICRELAVPRSSLLRWQHRQRSGAELIRRPGPPKVQPLNLNALQDEVRALAHGRQRTHGTGTLYLRHSAEISRRDLQALVVATRRELQQEQAALARRVEWLVPGLVWSMDDMQRPWLDPDPLRGRDVGHLHAVMDLASRYTLRSLGAAELADGARVAASLQGLIAQYGPPLFLKMDGGSNFHHQAVRQLLAARGIIPLVSPPHYPPYNGGIERQHQVVLGRLGGLLGDRSVSPGELVWACGVAGHEANHIQRRILGHQTACQALAGGRPLLARFGRRQREEVFGQIKDLPLTSSRQWASIPPSPVRPRSGMPPKHGCSQTL